MEPWIAILIVAGATGLVAWLVSRRSGPRVTTIKRTTHSDTSDEAEK